MRRKERAKIVQKVLDDLFPNPAIPLQHTDPFTLLIAVLLSASCTDERVNRTTPKLFALADTPQKMAKCEIDEVEKIIHSLGLSKVKAKNIVLLSKDIVEKHKGKVPASFEALEELPGVGHKTASVVMAQAFHKAAFPVDTHIHRLARRFGLTKGKTVEKTEKDLKELFAKTSWTKLHLQFIYFGRAYCPARGHHIHKCPICSLLI
jgi:endonuclease III